MGEFQAPSLEAGVYLLLHQGCQNANPFPCGAQWRFSKLTCEIPVEIWDAASGEVVGCVGSTGFLCLLPEPPPHHQQGGADTGRTQEWLPCSEVHHLLLTSHSNSLQRGCFISRPDFVFPGWSWENHCTSLSLSLLIFNMGTSAPTLQGLSKDSMRQYANSIAQVCG